MRVWPRGARLPGSQCIVSADVARLILRSVGAGVLGRGYGLLPRTSLKSRRHAPEPEASNLDGGSRAIPPDFQGGCRARPLHSCKTDASEVAISKIFAQPYDDGHHHLMACESGKSTAAEQT